MTLDEYIAPPPTVNRPLHPAPERSWACLHPERPRDEATSYDFKCRACALHASVSLRTQGDRSQRMHTSNGEESYLPLSWLVARARFHHPEWHLLGDDA